MAQELRILLLEDRQTDTELLLYELRREAIPFVAKQVMTESDFLAQLREFDPDLILADHVLPAYDGLSALATAQRERPEVPLIFVSGALGEERAVEALHRGATDYVSKQRLDRLGPALRRALRETRERHRRQQAEQTLRESEASYRLLFESNPHPMWVYDLQTLAFLAVNQTAIAHYGYSREEFLAMTIKDIRPPEDVPALLEIASRVTSGRNGTWRHRKKDGTLITVEITSHALQFGGHPARLVLANDITEHQRAEAEIRRQNRELSTLFAISRDSAQTLELETILHHGLEATLETLGIEAGGVYLLEPDGVTLTFTVHRGFTPEFVRAVQRIQLGEGISGLAIREKTPVVIGVEQYPTTRLAPWMAGFQTLASTPLLSAGELVGALNFATRRPRAILPEEVELLASIGQQLGNAVQKAQLFKQVHQSQAELATIYDLTPVITCVLDPQGRVLLANRAAVAFTGRPAEQLLKLQIGEALGCCHALEKPQGCSHSLACAPCPLRRAALETLASGQSHSRIEVELALERTGACHRVSLLASTASLQVAGQKRVLLYLEDITARKRAEEQIRSQAALLEVAQDAILVHDFSGRIHYWNSGATHLYGWTLEEALDQDLAALIFPPAAALELTQVRQRMLTDGEWTGEVRQRTKNQRELIVHSRWALVRSRDGRPQSILTVNTDITEKKQLEAQLMRAQRLESVGQLASGIAHDLNNVLTPIMMSVQLLQEACRGEAERLLLETLENCVHRGAGIVQQVLLFARGSEATRVLLQPKQLLQEMARIAKETFPKSIQVQLDFCRAPWPIQANLTQIQQVLMNLCVNARDAMPTGGTLALSLTCLELEPAQAPSLHPKARPGRYVALQVADTGTGISPEVLEKIFDPFFTTKPLGQGTGLGLPTSLGIVESHGGFIRVHSQPGAGSQFTVYLPAAESAQAEPPSAWTAAPPKGQGQSILVVDDELVVCQLVRTTLEEAGYRVILALNGEEALTQYHQHGQAIQAVLTDLMMPGMDGKALMQRLLALDPTLKIAAISGMATQLEALQAELPGLALVLPKPFTAPQLLDAVAALLSPAPAHS